MRGSGVRILFAAPAPTSKNVQIYLPNTQKTL
jgi:hypothetical protein